MEKDDDPLALFYASDTIVLEPVPSSEPSSSETGPKRLVCHAPPTFEAHSQLGVPVDPYLVRPQDLLRRAFDDLAFALHFFILGTMVTSANSEKDERKVIRFTTKQELVATEDTVHRLPVMKRTRKGQHSHDDPIKVYIFPEMKHTKPWKKKLWEFQTCIHSQEVGYLLQHVEAVNKNLNSKFYKGDAKQVAKSLFLIRNYLVHRNYLLLGNSHVQAVAALGEEVFALMRKLLQDCIRLDKIDPSLQQAVKYHSKSITRIRGTFLALKKTFYSDQASEFRSFSRTKEMVEALISELQKESILQEETIRQAEHFAIVNVASRLSYVGSQEIESLVGQKGGELGTTKQDFFSAILLQRFQIVKKQVKDRKVSQERERDRQRKEKTKREGQGKEKEEEKHPSEGHEGHGRNRSKPQKSWLPLWNSNVAYLQSQPIYLMDPFAVTHIDVLNRALDYLALSFRCFFLIGRDDAAGKKRTPCLLLFLMFTRIVLKRKLIPMPAGNRWLPSGQHEFYIKDTESTRLENQTLVHAWFRATKKLGRAPTAEEELKAAFHLVEKGPYVCDPYFTLQFLLRAVQPECDNNYKNDLKYRAWQEQLVRECTTHEGDVAAFRDLRLDLTDVAHFRDSLGHQANLKHAKQLRVDEVHAVIEKMVNIQKNMKRLFLKNPPENGWPEYEPTFKLLEELEKIVSVQPTYQSKYGFYQTFRHRQGQLSSVKIQGAVDPAQSNERRGRLRFHALQILQLLRQQLSEQDTRYLQREQAEKEKEKEKEKGDEGENQDATVHGGKEMVQILSHQTALLAAMVRTKEEKEKRQSPTPGSALSGLLTSTNVYDLLSDECDY